MASVKWVIIGSEQVPSHCLNQYNDLLSINTLRLRQDGCHFAEDIFMCIFFNENGCILITFSLKYVRKGSIDNNPALVQIMAWRRSGDKPLSETMMIILPTHICVTQPKWVKPLGTDFSENQWNNRIVVCVLWANFINIWHELFCFIWLYPGGCLNINMYSYQYRDSHHKYKVWGPSYLYNGNLHT